MNRRAEDDVHLHLDPCLTCAICRRFIIEEEDQVLALLRGPKSYYGHTNAITIPHIFSIKLPLPRATLHSVDSHPISRRICRNLRWPSCRSSPEATICHIACLNVISKHIYRVEPKKALKRICYTSVFFRAWPRAGNDYYGAREPRNTFSSLNHAIKACDSDMKDFSSLLHRVSQLPQEIIYIIETLCQESELWKLWSALAWSKTFYREKTSSRFLWELGNWQRGNQSFGQRTTGKFIFLVMDNQGLVQVKFLDQRPVNQSSNHGWWYACLETAKVTSIQAKLKGGRIHLNICPTNLALWDTPNIPDPTSYIHSYTNKGMSHRIRTIPLNRLTGLTFFMAHSRAYAIHPHYEDCSDSILQTYFGIEGVGLSVICWVFIPLKHRHIESLYLRTARIPDSAGQPSLVLKTSDNHIYHTGYYPPIEIAKKYKYKSIGIKPSMLIYQDPSSFGRSFEHYGSCTTQQGISDWYIHPHFEIYGSSYLSVVSLENVQAFATFCDETHGYCRGVLIDYHNEDEDQQVLGQCRKDLIREDFQISLFAFHWRQIKVDHTTHIKVAFSQNEQEMNDLCGKGYEAARGGKLMWLFNYNQDAIFKVPN